ncbi:hypothetical protein P872_06205 [Rhodonellum psychrophilum GCM71 = DSM 17998]|uniref:VWFA domain-containing protein n=2 Tax=Rhodonellum TaxID=336827 RepID=U5BYY4_9BACT|nr:MULTISPECIES: VWA domain-containing protein [Rhodonellum]ERM83063.1 hypothetical protein P872_06205 [Rhodonellum psychrophilum GCM71 = DSM 17998]SDZ47215.1 Uncharacterized conserved protein YegL, contains vWA domain of TerY type [Rhodonellum ikkaensis]
MSFNVETPENFEQKCLCVLVLDVSGSMSGEPINQLNKGIKTFHKEILDDSTSRNRLEVCVIEFASDVNVLVEPSLVENFTMPNLITKGSTKLVDGVKEAIQKVSERKTWYKNTSQKYYRPWIILMTDGAPDSDQDVNGLASEIKQGVANKSFFFFSVGVQGANMEVLKRISSPDMEPALLEGLKFSDFFKWLSASMTTVTSSKDGDMVNMPSPASWMKGFKI